MSILVVGSVALDTVETPSGSVLDTMGGSALYFSSASRFFAKTNVVGVVGKDFDFSQVKFLQNDGVNLDGLVVEEGNTFRWGGKYHDELNLRDTLFTELNVFENFNPVLPKHYQNCQYIFLANIDPVLQLKVLDMVDNPKLTVLDTMDYWIMGHRETLEKVLQRVDMLILNDEELQQLTNSSHLYKAANSLLKTGLKYLVIKRGEYGAVLVTNTGYFFTPAYPVQTVIDPTGAGDVFAGGLIGHLAKTKEINDNALRRAVVYGSVLASYTVEDFSFNNLKSITQQDIENRFTELQAMTSF